MSARTTPEERDMIARLLTRLLAERASLAAERDELNAEVERCRKERDTAQRFVRDTCVALGGTPPDDTERLAKELRAEVERLRQPVKGEVVGVRYAISHAPKGQKGGPWESTNGPPGWSTEFPDVAWTNESLPMARNLALELSQKVPTAHVVRFVTRKKAKR